MRLQLSWIKMELNDYILVFVLILALLFLEHEWPKKKKKNRIIKIKSAHPSHIFCKSGWDYKYLIYVAKLSFLYTIANSWHVRSDAGFK